MFWKMGWGLLASISLATLSLIDKTLAFDGRKRQEVQVVEATAGTLIELADELFLDFQCLWEANPLNIILLEGELISIPFSCCGSSCKGPLCCQREGCNQLTSSAAPPITASTTVLVSVTNTASPTTVPTSLSTFSITTSPSGGASLSSSDLSSSTSSVSVSTPTSNTGTSLSSSSYTTPNSTKITDTQSSTRTSTSSTELVFTTTNSDGSTVTSTISPTSSTASTGQSSSTVSAIPTPNSAGNSITSTVSPTILTISPTTSTDTDTSASNVETLTEPDGSSITLTLPPGSSIMGPITITTDSSVLTLGPLPSTLSSTSNVETLTEPNGNSVTVTLLPGSSITGLTTITTDGSALTVGPLPSSSNSGSLPNVETLTEPNGSIVTLTLPSGSTGLQTITTDGSTLTVGPVPVSTISSTSSIPNVETLTEPNGSSITLTLPPGSIVTELETLTTDGSTITVGPVVSFTSGFVTSTMTTLPPGLSIQDFTGSVTGNEWVTTTDASGSTTIIPVILPCPTCEPEIIWNLPEIPDVDFIWPQFPELPSFHLPCIKIFGIHIAGECPDPSGPPPSTDGPPPSPKPSNSEQSTTRSSSSSSCTETNTITDFFVSCTSVDATSTSCTTTSSFVTAGCSLTATASTTTGSSTATPSSYLVSSKSGTNPNDFQSFVNTLPDQGKGIFQTLQYIAWQTYLTNLTLDQAQNVSTQPLVDFVTPNFQDFTSNDEMAVTPRRKRALDPSINRQGRPDPSSRQDHLRLISAEPLFLGSLPPYVFDPTLGAGQTIYILDNGFNLNHAELSTTSGRTVTPYYVGNQRALSDIPQEFWGPDDSIADTDGHGTFVASIAGGVTAGVASRANLVLVKFKNQSRNPNNPASQRLVLPSASDVAVDYAWSWAISDAQVRRATAIVAGESPGKFIINMSGGFDMNVLPNNGAGRKAIMNRNLQAAWAADIITVVAAGNDGDIGRTLVSFTPTNLGTTDGPLVTVGGVLSDGTLDPITNIDDGTGGSISVYGVSRDVWGADFSTAAGLKSLTGTSFAAPAAAGLAAYFAGLPVLANQFPDGSVAHSMKDYIVENAKLRSANPFQNLQPNQQQPRAASGSIVVLYNNAPDGLCAVNAGTKRDSAYEHRGAIEARQSPVDAAGDYNIVVSGTVLDSSDLPSVCPLTSGQSSSPTTSPVSPTTNPSSPTAITPIGPSITTTAGSSTGSVPLTTSFISCSTQNQDPDQGITLAYCVCSGSTFAQSTNTQVTPANSCAYQSLPSTTIGSAVQTITTTQTNVCSVCTLIGQSETCTSIGGCTPAPTTTSTSTTPENPTGAFSVIYPSGSGAIQCHTDVDTTLLDACYDYSSKIDPNKVYSTDDNICFSQGDVIDQGSDVGGYCTIFALDTCSIVLGVEDFSIGPTKFSGQQVQDFLARAQAKCGSGPASVISTTSSDPDDQAGGYDQSFCLVHPGQESACGTNIGVPG